MAGTNEGMVVEIAARASPGQSDETDSELKFYRSQTAALATLSPSKRKESRYRGASLPRHSTD